MGAKKDLSVTIFKFKLDQNWNDKPDSLMQDVSLPLCAIWSHATSFPASTGRHRLHRKSSRRAASRGAANRGSIDRGSDGACAAANRATASPNSQGSRPSFAVRHVSRWRAEALQPLQSQGVITSAPSPQAHQSTAPAPSILPVHRHMPRNQLTTRRAPSKGIPQPPSGMIPATSPGSERKQMGPATSIKIGKATTLADGGGGRRTSDAN